MPRPISSRITSERGPAWFRIAAVSTISTMKVERPRARSSAAPTRREDGIDDADMRRFAGTKLPACARIAISAFCRRKVDLPAMFGPVKSQMRPEGSGAASSVRCDVESEPRRAQIAIVRDKTLPLGTQRLLHHRMAAALDTEGQAQIHLRPHVVFAFGKLGER